SLGWSGNALGAVKAAWTMTINPPTRKSLAIASQVVARPVTSAGWLLPEGARLRFGVSCDPNPSEGSSWPRLDVYPPRNHDKTAEMDILEKVSRKRRLTVLVKPSVDPAFPGGSLCQAGTTCCERGAAPFGAM
ncbi:hypothetical protein, partial [Thermogutta sp.]|uniref:hypothetical protein n=1 Tax=Thermogutta sp. TaxID=1962930 RepID=UPI0032204E07